MIYDIKKSLGDVSAHIKAPELNFQDFEGQNIQIFAYFGSICGPAEQIKHEPFNSAQLRLDIKIRDFHLFCAKTSITSRVVCIK